MNVAAFIVAAMNIPRIIECSSTSLCNARHSFLSNSHLVSDLIHKFCCVTSHDEIFGICLFLVIHCLKFPRSIVNQLSVPCRMRIPAEKRFLHDGVQLVCKISKKFSQVSLIDRAPQLHFSTLEKTTIDQNPLLNNLVVTVSQVFPIDRHLQQIFQDLDIHTRSSPGLMKLKKTRPKASSRSNSSWVAIWLWTRSSPVLVELVFAIAAVQAVEMKWLMLNKFNK